LTRFGVTHLLARAVATASATFPELATRAISPHTLRHTTAMHLLQAGVDVNVIRAWLGHVSLDTTHQYVEADLEMKRRALEKGGVALLLSGTRRTAGPPRQARRLCGAYSTGPPLSLGCPRSPPHNKARCIIRVVVRHAGPAERRHHPQALQRCQHRGALHRPA